MSEATPTPAEAVTPAVNTQPEAVKPGQPEEITLTLTSKQLKERLDRAVTKAIKEREEADAESKRQAELTLEQRNQEWTAKLEATERTANLKIALAGKVQDLDYALYKIQNSDKYTDKKGNVDIEAFLKDNPNQSVQPASKLGPAPISGGGNANLTRFDMNSIIRAKAGKV